MTRQDDVVEIVVPEGSFGEEDEDTWAGLLRRLTREIAQGGHADPSGGLLGGEWGYGAPYENDVFLMHHFCWCEQEDCPWCIGCSCEFAYFYGDREVSEEQFWAPSTRGFAEPGARSEVTRRCDYCATGGVAATKGGGPGHNAPNFWHKATGAKVWWYKYIGRGMEFDGSADPLVAISEAIASLHESPIGVKERGKA
jgi:hypothetical protein